jgi:site-specific recombinase XerD
MEISTVRRTHIVEFRNSVAAKLSAVTTNGDLNTVRQIFRRARLEGYIVGDPTELVEGVQGDTAKKRAFTVRELQRLLEPV